jgi:hypothetical protein
MSDNLEKQPIIAHQEKKFIHPNSSAQMLYANGFVGGQTTFDIYVIGMINSMPGFTLNMSFTTAKALAGLMTKLVNDFEKNTGIIIPTTEEISAKLKEADKKIANEQ